MLASQQFCVKWNSYSSNLQNVFPRLLTSEHFVDITLACEGQMIKCHKVVLSACSTYFEKLLVQNPCQHPIIFMKDMKHWEVQALVDFMYKGEVNVSQDELNSLLVAAEALQIRGLCGSDHVNRPDGNRPSSSSGVSKIPLPHDMVLSGSTAVGRDSPPSCKRRRPPNEEKDQFQPALPRISNVTSASVNSKGGSITDVNPLPTSQMPIVDQIKTDGPEDDMDQDIPEKRTIKQEVDMEDSYLEGDMDADGPDEDYGSLEHRDDSDSNNCEDTHPGSPLDQPGPSGMVPPTSAPVEKGATDLHVPLPVFNARVERELVCGHPAIVMKTVIDECARVIFSVCGDQGFKNKQEYNEFCRRFYQQYPNIGEPGPNPWTKFAKRLSQKQRFIRWRCKRGLN